MTGKDLLKSMDDIDMQYIKEAENADSIDMQYDKEAENADSIVMQYDKEAKNMDSCRIQYDKETKDIDSCRLQHGKETKDIDSCRLQHDKKTKNIETKCTSPVNKKNARRLKKPWRKWAAAAACLAILTAMGSTAFANQFGLGIQDWLTNRWTERIGTSMSEGQSETIARLSQYVGKSSTVGDIRVTVDSYTSGRHLSWMLVNITGFPFDRDTDYYFQHWKIKINSRDCGGSIQQLGVNEAGAYQILFRHSGSPSLSLIDPPDLYDGDTWKISLELADFKARAKEEPALIQEGKWKVSFETSNTNKAPVIKLDGIQVEGCHISSQKKRTVPVTNIELSETGISYSFSYRWEDPVAKYPEDFVRLPEPVLLFKNGSELSENPEPVSSCAGKDADDIMYVEEEFAWPAPVSLEEVSGVRFGDEVILLPEKK